MDADIDEEPTNFNTQGLSQQPNNQPRVINSGTTTFNFGNLGTSGLGGLSSLLGSLTGQQQPNRQNNQGQFSTQQQPPMMGGLNLGGLMSMLGAGNLGMNMNNQVNRPTQPNNQQNNQQ